MTGAIRADNTVECDDATRSNRPPVSQETDGGVPMSAPVFSPSQTRDWTFCPVYWWLQQTHVYPRRIGKKEASAALGTAFARAVALYNTDRKHGFELNPTAYQTLGQGTLAHQLNFLTEMGCQWEESALTPEALSQLLDTALARYIQEDPIPRSWKILDIEYTIPGSGQSRLDLGVEDGQGLAIVDYKLRLTLDDRYYDRTVSGYVNDHQQLHYAYFYGLNQCRPVERYYILLVVLTPRFSARLHPFSVCPETLQVWHHFTQQAWRHMEAQNQGDESLWMAAQHANQYGPCPMIRYCFEYRMDMTLAAHEYVQGAGESHGPA